MRFALFLFSVLALLGVSFSVNISNCSILSSPGIYTLNQSVVGAPNSASPFNNFTCMKITSSNVTLDCMGFTVTNDGTPPTTHGIIAVGVFPTTMLTNVTVRNCVNVSGYNAGIRFEFVNNSEVLNSSVRNATSAGIEVSTSFNVTVRGNYVNGTNPGIMLLSADNNTVVNNTAVNGGIGYELFTASNNTVVNNTAANGTFAYLFVINSNNNLFRNNVAFNNSNQAGFDCQSDSNNNNITNNSVTFHTGSSGRGMLFSDCHNNVVSDNQVINNSNTGIQASFSTNNTFLRNVVANNTFGGFTIAQGSNDSVIANNTVFLTTDAFSFSLSSVRNLVANNTAFNNSGTGFRSVSAANNNTFVNNLAYRNGVGFDSGSANGNFTNNTAHSNNRGMLVSAGTNLSNHHSYNNSVDLSTSGNIYTLTMRNVVFDNPAGNFANYSNISVDDTVPVAGGSYNMTWSPQPAALPPSTSSFAGKFLNITNTSTNVSFEQITWSWLASEVGGSDENEFELWKFNSSGWVLLNTSPDTAANTLSLFNHNPASVYAVLEVSANCPVISTPGAYVQAGNYTGAPNSVIPLPGSACVVINSSHVDYDCAGFNITNNGTAGTTYGVLVHNSTGLLTNVTVRNCIVGGYFNGIDFENVTSAVARNNSATGNSQGFAIVGSPGMQFINNIARNSSTGYLLSYSPDVLLVNNTARNGGLGFRSSFSSDNNTYLNNTARDNTDTGFFMAEGSDNHNLSGNLAINNSLQGFEITVGSDNSRLASNIAGDNGGDGFDFLSNSNNTAVSNTAYNNSVGFFIDADSNTLSGNTAYNNTFNGFTLWGGNNTLSGNTAYGNGAGNSFDSGFLVECCSANDNVLINNTAHSNTGGAGFYQYYSTGNVFTGNIAYNNTEHGIEIEGDPATLVDNDAYNNSVNGFHIHDGDGNALSGNAAHGNAQSGIRVEFGDLTTISGGHLYGNNPDFTFETFTLNTVNLSSVVFDNPAGNFTDYTNISMNASNDDDLMTLNWSAQPDALPSTVHSFANKHLNITGGSLVVVDSAVWHWLDSEPGAAEEGSFQLWKYNGTWGAVAASLDTAANTLSASNLTDFSVFSVLVSNGCPAPITAPGTYSLTGSVVGASNPVSGSLSGIACVHINSSDVIFDCNGFNITNNGTSGPGIVFGVLSQSTVAGQINNVTIRNCPNISGYDEGVSVISTTNGRVINTSVEDASSAFIVRTNSNGTQINLTTAFNYTTGYTIASPFIALDNNTAHQGVTGFAIIDPSEILVNNLAFDNSNYGISVSTSGGSFLQNNVAHDNAFAGIQLSDSDGNTLTSNIGHSNGETGILVSGTGNNVTNNTAHSNGQRGFLVSGHSANTFSDNVAYNNSVWGFQVADSDSNTFTGELSFSNLGDGFELQLGSDSNTLTDINSSGNALNGLLIGTSSTGNSVGQSTFCNNSLSGVLVMGTNTSTVSGSLSCDNGGAGFSVVSSTLNNFTSNNASGNFRGFELSAVGSSTFTDNLASLNSENGFNMGSTSGNVFTGNIASNNTDGFNMNGNSNVFSDNLASDNADNGFELGGAPSNSFNGDTAVQNGNNGFQLGGSGSNNFTDVNASSNGVNGMFAVASGSNRIDPSFFCFNAQNGLVLSTSSNGNTVSDSVACNNGMAGIVVNVSSGTAITGVSATDNAVAGIALADADSNNVTGSFANGSTAGIVLITNSDGNLVTGNTVVSNSLAGIAAIDGSSSNVLSGNTAQFNGLAGIAVIGADGNNLSGNNATSSASAGIALLDSFGSFSGPVTGNTVSGNLAANNSEAGIVLSGADSNRLSGNNVFGNPLTGITLINGSDGNNLTGDISHGNGIGLVVNDSDANLVSGMHLYNNSPDFSGSGTGMLLSLAGVIFDSPSGSFTNYTNLTVNDTLASGYILDHTVQPAPFAGTEVSFRGKFINVSGFSGNVSIDSAVWSWLESELGGVQESNLALYRYNGSVWSNVNSTANPSVNTLSQSGLSVPGVYALVAVTPGGAPNDDGGGGTPSGLQLDITPLCGGFSITVEDGQGDPVENAFVEVQDETNGQELAPRYTDSSGKVFYTTCNIDIDATAVKSDEDGHLSGHAACGICEECQTDVQCPDSMQCVFGFCKPIQCSCGQVSNHQCVEYQCCADSDCGISQVCTGHKCVDKFECDRNDPADPSDDNADCPDNKFCDILPGASGGSCRDVTGQCGYASNHAWVTYECGPEAGCPQCPAGQQCLEHECVTNDLDCPLEGVVGMLSTCRATTEGGPCPDCTLRITGPDGKTFTGSTRPDGTYDLPLRLTGNYKVELLDKDGNVIMVQQVRSLAAKPPGEEEKPSSTSTDLMTLLWLLLLLLIIAAGIFYWRSRSGKKK